MHRGPIGLHTVFPNRTNKSLRFNQYFLLVISVSLTSVSSGVLVWTRFRRFDIRWTCVSTGIAGVLNP